MHQYVCPACKNGSHRACYGTHRARAGYMGGTTCICDDKVHKDPNFKTVQQELAERKAPGMEVL